MVFLTLATKLTSLCVSGSGSFWVEGAGRLCVSGLHWRNLTEGQISSAVFLIRDTLLFLRLLAAAPPSVSSSNGFFLSRCSSVWLSKLSIWIQNQISAWVPSLSSPSTVTRKIQRLARSLRIWSYRYLVAAAGTEKDNNTLDEKLRSTQWKITKVHVEFRQ